MAHHRRKRSRRHPKQASCSYIPKRHMGNDSSRRVFRDRRAGWIPGRIDF